MLRSAVALLLTIFALAGCASAEASTPAMLAATPSLPCSLPYGTQVSLVAPLPGSTGPVGSIVLVASRNLPKTVALVATDRKGNVTPAVALERLARPRSAARPAFADPVYYRAAGVSLRAHRHYTLALEDVAQNGCAPYAAMTGNARFST
jgi:hypothetical protein